MTAGSGTKAAWNILTDIFSQAVSAAVRHPKTTLVGLYMVFNFACDTRHEYHTLQPERQHGQLSYLIEDTIKDGVRFTVNLARGLYNGATGAWDENFDKNSFPCPHR